MGAWLDGKFQHAAVQPQLKIKKKKKGLKKMGDWFFEIFGRSIHGEKCHHERCCIIIHWPFTEAHKTHGWEARNSTRKLRSCEMETICVCASNELPPVFTLTRSDLRRLREHLFSVKWVLPNLETPSSEPRLIGGNSSSTEWLPNNLWLSLNFVKKVLSKMVSPSQDLPSLHLGNI